MQRMTGATADLDRDDLGRPTAALGWSDLLSVSAYWLAITTLMGALSVIIIPLGVCLGVFLAVDWALMTDIIPKAESGRYMA